MNKKISVLTIIFTGILSLNAFSKTETGTNIGKETSEVNVIQGDINALRNVALPNTDMSKSVGFSKNALSAPSTKNTIEGWGQTPTGQLFFYKNGIFTNCTKGSESKCKEVQTEECNGILVPKGACGSNGFISSNYSEVLSDGTDNLFYRYWITVNTSAYKDCDTEGVPDDDAHPCECQYGKLGGCWSPAYPIIAYNGFNKSTFDGKTKTNEVKNYFGERTNFSKTGGKAIKNQYSTGKEYFMGVKIAAHGEKDSLGLKDIPTGALYSGSKVISSKDASTSTYGVAASIPVQSWSKLNGGLDPNFNYANLKTNGVKENILNDTLIGLSNDPYGILPCGMFTLVSNKIEGVTQNSGVTCRSDNLRVVTDNSGNQLYTYYHVALPTNNGFESTFTHDLKYRACAKCESLTKESACKDLIQQLINNGKNTYDSLVEALRNNNSAFSGFQIKKNGKLYATYNGLPSCNDCLGQLDKVLPSFASQLN